ncbi:PREDICTED: basic proline-rich protein-like [Rhinopithecus bieti]|uniref:basic proline-rich protein-like n=1 Tax=Rhinopithecus bieti TaxID=61621 RepID=UPI00083BCB9C|nr:PREDICTED: basic proline-rich protein-like [Rhinopithecus bieti]
MLKQQTSLPLCSTENYSLTLPAPPGVSPSPEGGHRAGRGRPARSPPPAATRRRGTCREARVPLPECPGPEKPPAGSRAGRARPPLRPGPRAPRAPAEGKGTKWGRSCKQPQRPGLASKSPAFQARPRAAPAPNPPRGRRARGPGHRRGVGSPPRRAPGARGAAPGAEKGEVRTYLSLLSTPSWIHLSTSPQSIMGSPTEHPLLTLQPCRPSSNSP